MKNKIKLIPVDAMNIVEMESYLSDMSAKGYLLKKVRGVGYFEKAVPQKMNYRLAPFIEASKPADNQLKIYQSRGWTYVCTIGKIFNVYRCAGENPIEVDENSEELIRRYEMISHNLKGILWLNGITALIYFLMLGLSEILDETKMLSAVQYDTWWYIAVMLLTIMMSSESNIRIRLKLKELTYKLKLGPLQHNQVECKIDYKTYVKKYIEEGISILLLVLTVIFLINGFTGGWERTVSTYRDKLPMVTLQEIEQDVNLEITHHIYRNKNYDDFIAYKRTGLAPRIYEIEQGGKIQGRTLKNNEYIPWIKTEFYEVRFKGIAQPLLKDLIHDNVKFYDAEITYQKLEDTGFDEAIYVHVGERQMLFVRLGKKVMYTCYEGEKDIKQYITEIYSRISAF
nr:DUF2812 domain-containing protein [uncultured Cellulosilyticum sp.]